MPVYAAGICVDDETMTYKYHEPMGPDACWEWTIGRRRRAIREALGCIELGLESHAKSARAEQTCRIAAAARNRSAQRTIFMADRMSYSAELLDSSIKLTAARRKVDEAAAGAGMSQIVNDLNAAWQAMLDLIVRERDRRQEEIATLLTKRLETTT